VRFKRCIPPVDESATGKKCPRKRAPEVQPAAATGMYEQETDSASAIDDGKPAVVLFGHRLLSLTAAKEGEIFYPASKQRKI
jgi:hypothetical protein